MSVTDGGIFSALQSSWHTHRSLSFPLFPFLSLPDLLLCLYDQEWEALSRRWSASPLAEVSELCLMFRTESCRYTVSHFGSKNSASHTNHESMLAFKWSACLIQTLTRSCILPNCPGGPESPFSPGGPISPTGPGSPMRPLSPWRPLSPGIPGSPFIKKAVVQLALLQIAWKFNSAQIKAKLLFFCWHSLSHYPQTNFITYHAAHSNPLTLTCRCLSLVLRVFCQLED